MRFVQQVRYWNISLQDQRYDKFKAERKCTNKEVKLLLIEFLSDKVQFWKPYQANQSFIVFSSNLSEKHVIQKLQSVNPIKLAATKIRKSLINLLLILKTNFVMQKNLKTPGTTLISYTNRFTSSVNFLISPSHIYAVIKQIFITQKMTMMGQILQKAK